MIRAAFAILALSLTFLVLAPVHLLGLALQNDLQRKVPVLFHRIVCRILGVRNSTHTLVKLLQPFAQPALRLNSYTHPEYLAMLTEYLSTLAPSDMGDVFLMRGTEGEAVANVRRAQQITWFHAGRSTVLVEREEPSDEVPSLPPADAAATATWIGAVLRGEQAVPPAIAEQAEHCLRVARQLKARA